MGSKHTFKLGPNAINRKARSCVGERTLFFDLEIPSDRSGNHVLWIAWQRDDPAGEVFISTSDLSIIPSSCPDELDLSTINQTEYQASQNISCDAYISSPFDLIIKAGNFIELLPSFELEYGASIGIYMEGCGANKGASREVTIVPSDSSAPHRKIFRRRMSGY